MRSQPGQGASFRVLLPLDPVRRPADRGSQATTVGGATVYDLGGQAPS